MPEQKVIIFLHSIKWSIFLTEIMFPTRREWKACLMSMSIYFYPHHQINTIHFFFYHTQDKHNIICKVKTTNSKLRHKFTQNRRLNELYCQWYKNDTANIAEFHWSWMLSFGTSNCSWPVTSISLFWQLVTCSHKSGWWVNGESTPPTLFLLGRSISVHSSSLLHYGSPFSSLMDQNSPSITWHTVRFQNVFVFY